MPDYQAVLSGHEISKKIADLLEDIDSIQYNGSNRARRVRNVNDYIQGRNDMPLEPLLDWAAKADGGAYAGKVAVLRQSIRDFQAQKALLAVPYTRTSHKQFEYKTIELEMDRPLKVIDQQIYDRAAKSGFPRNFFQESYFDHVTLYCMPDNANCNFSHFSDCSFHVCRLYGVKFWDTRLYGCEFHSCRIEFTLFPDSTLANTHFRDCSIHSAAFLRSRMTRCNTVDCSVGRLNFNGARLDGCTYGRITRLPNSRIEGLEDASITMGGATQEEVRYNRNAIFHALGEQDPEHPGQPGPAAWTGAVRGGSMRRNNTVSPLLWAALTLPVLYLAALLASGYEEGMTVFDLMGRFSELLERPFAIRWTPHTPNLCWEPC